MAVEAEGGVKDDGVGLAGSKDDIGKLKSEGGEEDPGGEKSETSFREIGAVALSDFGCPEESSLIEGVNFSICEGGEGTVGTGIVGRTGSGRCCLGSVLYCWAWHECGY
jgi:hypothetical protein